MPNIVHMIRVLASAAAHQRENGMVEIASSVRAPHRQPCKTRSTSFPILPLFFFFFFGFEYFCYGRPADHSALRLRESHVLNYENVYYYNVRAYFDYLKSRFASGYFFFRFRVSMSMRISGSFGGRAQR